MQYLVPTVIDKAKTGEVHPVRRGTMPEFDPDNVARWEWHYLWEGMEKSPEGDYVRFEDYSHLLGLYREAMNEEPVKAYRPEIGVVGRVFDYYRERAGKSKLYTLTRLRQKKGLLRLRECLRKTGGNLTNAEEMMKICVDALVASRFHMGENAAGKTYNDWADQLFGSEERMEKWLEEAQR